MPNRRGDEEFFHILSAPPETAHEERASSRLRARVYSALIREQQQTGPLRNLSETEEAGHGLCIFEKLVQIAPVGERAKSPFFCWACHARMVAENVENAPIFWTHCPYVAFQGW